MRWAEFRCQDPAIPGRAALIEPGSSGYALVAGWFRPRFTVPWGFDPATITVPTQVWYGTADVMVPPAHGEWIARTVPGAVVRLNELGHAGDPDADLVELCAWPTGAAER